MSRERITAVGETAALLLPKEVLDKLGIAIGDEVELSLIDRTLMLQPLDEAARGQKLEINRNSSRRFATLPQRSVGYPISRRTRNSTPRRSIARSRLVATPN